MDRSEQINELAAALAKAQAELRPAREDRTNPAFRSRYATLESVWDACRGALSRHGLSVAQFPAPSPEGFLYLETVLLHSSGQFLSSIATMPLQKNDPQGYGSALTYARRYALSAVLGICEGDDDDANAATGQGAHGNGQQPRPAPTPPASGSLPATPTQSQNHPKPAAPSAGKCPECHAPDGKPHVKTCSQFGKTPGGFR